MSIVIIIIINTEVHHHQMFNLFDEDGNGSINVEELLNMMAFFIEIGEKFSAMVIVAAIHVEDINIFTANVIWLSSLKLVSQRKRISFNFFSLKLVKELIAQ